MNLETEIIKAIDNVKPGSIIIYDIDGTLITPSGEPILNIINTYRYALSKNLKPVIITARPGFSDNILGTISQLKSVGVTNFIAAFFLPVNKVDQATFKLLARKSLLSITGKEAVISVGDMPWDIGAYGGKGFIVPSSV